MSPDGLLTPKIRPEDRELLRTVAVDLAAMRKSWGSAVDDDELRRSSSVLRRLLIHGDYGRAWRLIFPKEPRVRTMDLVPTLEPYGVERALWAQAGGGTFGEVQVAHLVIWGFALPAEDIKRRHEAGPQKTTFGLSNYLRSPAIIARGNAFSRQDIIKYVSNKLGGAHLDSQRAGNEARFEILDEALDQVVAANKRAPYFELLSIGQDVLRSNDAARLIKATTSLFGPVRSPDL